MPGCHDTMTERYETPRLLGQPSNAHSYHTRKCRTVKMSKHEPEEASQTLIEWHGLEECKYCNRTHKPDSSANTVVVDD